MLEPAKKNKGEGASSVHTRCTVKKEKNREIIMGKNSELFMNAPN
jgi:hypothetical protein